MATVTDAHPCLSYNYHSDSNLSLVGTGFVKVGPNPTAVTVRYPKASTSTTATYEWTGKVHKVSKDGTKAEVKVTQNKLLSAEERKKEKDVTDTVRILVDASSKDVMAELYEE
jgi:hypothetical protein